MNPSDAIEAIEKPLSSLPYSLRLANRLNSLLRRFDDRDLYHTLIWLCWYDLMCAHSMQPWTEELKHKSHAELENWAVARKREKRELELMIDEYLLYAC
ncbi:hypothetical protein A177_03591 [Escherichia coli KTE216]|nr:hypothetical protein A177_03591 [Escherichia coli KTE216]